MHQEDSEPERNKQEEKTQQNNLIQLFSPKIGSITIINNDFSQFKIDNSTNINSLNLLNDHNGVKQDYSDLIATNFLSPNLRATDFHQSSSQMAQNTSNIVKNFVKESTTSDTSEVQASKKRVTKEIAKNQRIQGTING